MLKTSRLAVPVLLAAMVLTQAAPVLAAPAAPITNHEVMEDVVVWILPAGQCPNLPADQRTVTRWFDATALAAPSLGTFGTASKGSIIGPGLNVWNAGLAKTFAVTERFRFRGELTAVNVFNHPNWSNPALTISQPGTVGVISGVGGNQENTAERQLRLGLRAEW